MISDVGPPVPTKLSSSVPPEIFVAPAYVLCPVKVCLPAPVL